ncbi:MAG: hypothetical protein ABIS17_09360 [Casimicrobiaceae bacterium]
MRLNKHGRGGWILWLVLIVVALLAVVLTSWMGERVSAHRAERAPVKILSLPLTGFKP